MLTKFDSESLFGRALKKGLVFYPLKGRSSLREWARGMAPKRAAKGAVVVGKRGEHKILRSVGA